ncbi:MAG: endonuclease V [archaeon]
MNSYLDVLSEPPKALTPKEAHDIQEELSNHVIKKSTLTSRLTSVAGMDAAYRNDKIFSAAAAHHFETMELMEITNLEREVVFPYIPGLLAFREAPSLIEAARQLKTKVDVFIVDGHGYAHPRRFGLACHVGLALDAPVIGVAKNLLVGHVDDSWVFDDDEVIGRVVSPRRGRELYVSIGHKISLRDAVKVITKCTLDSSPEPIRCAHLEANRLRRRVA